MSAAKMEPPPRGSRVCQRFCKSAPPVNGSRRENWRDKPAVGQTLVDRAGGLVRMPKSLFGYVWRVGVRAQLLLAGLAVIVTILDLIPLELQRRIVNQAIERHAMKMLVWLALAYAVIVLFQGAAKVALNIYRGRIGESANRRLRLETFAAALRYPAYGDAAGQEGVGVSIILSEVEPIGGFIGNAISEPVLHAGVLISVFGYMVYLQPWMALVTLGVFAPQAFFVPALQQAINRRTESRIRVQRELSVDIVNETVDHVPVREEHAYRNWVSEIYRLNMQIYRRKFSMNFGMNLLHHLGIVGILLVGGWFVMQGRIEIGTIVAFISGLNRVNDPWGDLVNYFRELTNARVKYQLIAGVLDQSSTDPGRAAVAATGR
jgi:ABC-type bacteriocin/lantibiotic exporter with double-glycine peptidase domain